MPDFGTKLKGRTAESKSFQDDDPSISTRNTDTIGDFVSAFRESRSDQTEYMEKKLKMQEQFFHHQKQQLDWQKQAEEAKIAQQKEQFEWQKEAEKKKNGNSSKYRET